MKIIDESKMNLSQGIKKVIAINSNFGKEVAKSIKRFRCLDWGDISAEEKDDNDIALVKRIGKVTATYKTSYGEIQIIAENNRCHQSIRFKSGY